MVIETTVFTEQAVVVGIGELRIARSPSPALACIGLGSCIAVCMYDRATRIGGMAHVVLPSSEGRDIDNLSKYADTAVPLLLSEIAKQGGFVPGLIVKIAGGAQMSLAPGTRDAFKTGERNLEEVLAALERAKMPLASIDTGGNKGRTVYMYLDTGRVTVRTIGGVSKEI